MVEPMVVEQQGEALQGRLVITKMVMTDFKSYAGEQVVGEFHKNFSSVVGPNGSGKSNVIDAMLFVFGFRAKKLRLNKVSELIHNSMGRQNIPRASVMVHFHRILDRDDDTFDVVPGSELVVGRTAHRNNQSDYYLDGHKRQQKEVVARLLLEGIDLDNNRFLILQGEVEQISLMKPKAETEHDTGLLEYLSDIIGVSHYEQMLRDFATELETLTEDRQSKVAQTKRVEAQRDALTGDRDVALAYLSQQTELFLCHDRLNQNMTMLAAEAVATIRANREQVLEFKEHEDQKIGGVKAACDELAATRNQRLKAVEQGQRNWDGVTKEVELLERSVTKSAEDGKANAAKAKKQKASKAKLEASLKTNETQRDELPGEIQQLQSRCSDIGQLLVDAEKKLEALNDDCRGDREAIVRQQQEVESKAAPSHEAIARARAAQSEPAAERDLLCQQQGAAEKRYEEAQAGAQQAERQTSESKKAVQGFKADLEHHTNEAAKQRAKEKNARGCAEEAGAQLRNIQGRLAHSQRAAHSERSRGVVENALAEAVTTGRIRGKVYGALGKLGCIAREYDYAVSSACGGLENIVVDSAATARACVSLLRERNLGVATFLILESQKHPQPPPTNPPEGCVRLFDLVKVSDPKLLRAFYHSMRETLVVKDMEQASRIAYSGQNSRRVVTMKGDLIDNNGTMTGGGNKARSGRMRLGSTPPSGAALGASTAAGGSAADEEAATLEQSSAQLQRDLAEANQAIGEATAAIKIAERGAAEADTAMQKSAMAAVATAATAEDLRGQLPSLKQGAKVSKSTQVQLAALERLIGEQEAEVTRHTAEAAEWTARAAQLAGDLANVGGQEMKKCKEAVQNLQAELASGEEEATRKQVQLAAAEKAAVKIARDAAAAAKALAEIEDAEKKRSEQYTDSQGGAFKLQSRLEDATEELARLQGELAEAEAILGRKEAEVAVVIQKQEEFAEKLAEQEAKLKQEKSSLKQWQAKLQAERNKFSSAHPAEDAPPDLDEEALTNVDARAERARITTLEDSLTQSAPDMSAIDRHKERCAEYEEKVAALEEATSSRDQKRRQLEATRRERLDRFMAGFNTVSGKLKEMYQMITLGGDAELELVDSLDPFAEGIIFSVRPPKKSWRNIANLSGGEKTLSSLSLVFALHHFRPTPLYVMDEIDAALDFKNVSIVAHYIKERTRNAQFIIISLRSNMFELADRLVGIYKTDNATKSVAIDPKAFQLTNNTLTLTPSPPIAV